MEVGFETIEFFWNRAPRLEVYVYMYVCVLKRVSSPARPICWIEPTVGYFGLADLLEHYKYSSTTLSS